MLFLRGLVCQAAGVRSERTQLSVSRQGVASAGRAIPSAGAESWGWKRAGQAGHCLPLPGPPPQDGVLGVPLCVCSSHFRKHLESGTAHRAETFLLKSRNSVNTKAKRNALAQRHRWVGMGPPCLLAPEAITRPLNWGSGTPGACISTAPLPTWPCAGFYKRVSSEK